MTFAEGLPARSDAAAEQPQLSLASTSYIPTLDGWRAIAIGIVILAHASSSMSRALGAWFEPARQFFHAHGLLGVRIFFGISGYLITSRLIAELQNRREGSLKKFYTRRAFRILPPALVYLAAAGILMLTGFIVADAKGWLAAMFFCVNYVGAHWYVDHFWSLAVEEHFYLLWPAALALLGSRRGLKAAVVAAIFFALWRVTRFYLHWYQDGKVWAQTDFQLDGLLWGAAFACLCTNAHMRQLLQRALAGFRGYLLMALFLASLALPYVNWKFNHATYAAQAFVIPLLLLATILYPRGVLGRVLEWTPLRWVGHISYSLYLWQELFLPNDAVRAPRLDILQRWPLNIVLVFACAAASYYLVEQPMIRFGRRFGGGTKTAQPIRVELAERLNDASAH